MGIGCSVEAELHISQRYLDEISDAPQEVRERKKKH